MTSPELRDLAEAYAESLDRRDVGALVRLFHEDGELRVFEHGQQTPALVYRGHERLAELLDLVTIFEATFHLVMNHRSTVLDDRATGTTYCSARHLSARGHGHLDTEMLLRYDDAYRLGADGWRFERRDIHRQWTVVHEAERAPVPRSASSVE